MMSAFAICGYCAAMVNVDGNSARGRWRFSLLTLLLTVALTMAVLSHAWTSWQLHQLRKLDDRLLIGSEDRIYIRMMRESSPDLCRLRVYLPSGHRFYLHVATTNVSNGPIVPEASQELMNVTGEFVVDIIRRIDDPPSSNGQTWEIRCHRYGEPLAALIQSMRITLEKENHPSAFTFWSNTREFDPEDRSVVFKATQPLAPSTPPDRQNAGILVWIDTSPPKAASQR